MIFGAPFSGKSTLSKHLQSKYPSVLLDYEKISAQLKEKLGGEEGALEEVPFEHLCQHFAGVIRAQPEGQMVLFDGWNFGTKELERLFTLAGNPKNIVIY